MLYFVLWSIASVLGYRFLPVHFTPLMGIRVMEQLVDGEKPKVSHRWVPYSQISDNMKRAVLASEDQRFFNHNGFDMVEIKGLKENKTRKRPRGASTISQQTAKISSSGPVVLAEKGLKAYFTVLIELFWSKERILTVYLNCIETGDGIYGVEAVAREHFDTTADKLTASQSALIAATLPNPLKYSSKNPSSYMKRRQSQILKQMRTVKLPPVAEKG